MKNEYSGNDIRGWAHDCELQFLYNSMFSIPEGSTVVEVGSWRGKSAHALASGIRDSGKKAKLFCVDTFTGALSMPPQLAQAQESDIFEEFKDNLKEFSFVTPIRSDSSEAAKTLDNESIDFFWLDADHTEPFVRSDLLSWYPKVKFGAVMCGHDYRPNWQGVKVVVDNLIGKVEVHPESIWKWVKVDGVFKQEG